MGGGWCGIGKAFNDQTLGYINEVLNYSTYHIHCRGHAVAQLVEALRYKPEGRGFDSRWRHWNFPLT